MHTRSFPLRERGLKPSPILLIISPAASFPLRERGLKQCDARSGDCTVRVVPLAGTWIETKWQRIYEDMFCVVPLAGTWIETKKLLVNACGLSSRSPCGNVD